MSTSLSTETQRALSVGEYADRLNAALHRSGPALVEGEVQEVKTLASRVLSFTLTDGAAKLPCKWLPWESRGRRLTHTPVLGERVRVSVAYASWWKQGGKAEVVVSDIRLTGDGELLAARAALLLRLAAEGLCDPARFPPLPRFPTGVGLIAGRDSDACRDVVRGLRDRFPAVPVVTCCCRVQGAGAVAAIIESLIALAAHPLVDVIVIARGGGSVQDLATFDDERLCRAIRAIGKPIVTAIGHTANNPVCNHITHAAFVPRHAAALVVPDRLDLLRDIDDASAAMRRAAGAVHRLGDELDLRCAQLELGRALGVFRAGLTRSAAAIDARADRYLSARRARLEDARVALTVGSARARRACASGGRELERFADAGRGAASRALGLHRVELAHRGAEVSVGCANRLSRLRAQVESRGAVLGAADFRQRGWLLATRDGEPVTSARQLHAGDPLRLHLNDGSADALITGIHRTESEL